MASHKYDIVDEHGTGATAVVQGLGTWTGPTLDGGRTPNILVEADLSAISGTGPGAQLKIDSSSDNGVTFGNGDVYAGPTYGAVAHWGYRGTITGGKKFRIRVIVTGTGPSASFAVTVLGAANS